jgi:hypothetical protein
MGILRIPRVDDRDSYVLVKVDRAGGSRPLDVKLVATDGSEPYEVTGSSSNFHLISIGMVHMATLDAEFYASNITH